MRRSVAVSVAAAAFLLAGVEAAYADQCENAREVLSRSMEPGADPREQYQIAVQAQRMCPTLGWALSFEGRLWADSGESSKALGLLDRAMDLDPTDEHVLKDALHIHRLGGNMSKALSLLKTMQNTVTGDPEYYFDAGLTLLSDGQTDRARHLLELCAQADQEAGHCDFELGRLFLRKGQKNMALAAFGQAIRKNPTAYTSYTVQAELDSMGDRWWSYLGIAALLLLLLGITAAVLYLRRRMQIDEQRRANPEQRAGHAVEVSLRKTGTLDVSEGSGIEIMETGHSVEAVLERSAWMALFAVMADGRIQALSHGRRIDVTLYDGSAPVKGTLHFKIPGEVAYCYAVASTEPYHFTKDIKPHVDKAIKLASDGGVPGMLSLPMKQYGQSQLIVRN